MADVQYTVDFNVNSEEVADNLSEIKSVVDDLSATLVECADKLLEFNKKGNASDSEITKVAHAGVVAFKELEKVMQGTLDYYHTAFSAADGTLNGISMLDIDQIEDTQKAMRQLRLDLEETFSGVKSGYAEWLDGSTKVEKATEDLADVDKMLAEWASDLSKSSKGIPVELLPTMSKETVQQTEAKLEKTPIEIPADIKPISAQAFKDFYSDVKSNNQAIRKKNEELILSFERLSSILKELGVNITAMAQPWNFGKHASEDVNNILSRYARLSELVSKIQERMTSLGDATIRSEKKLEALRGVGESFAKGLLQTVLSAYPGELEKEFKNLGFSISVASQKALGFKTHGLSDEELAKMSKTIESNQKVVAESFVNTFKSLDLSSIIKDLQKDLAGLYNIDFKVNLDDLKRQAENEAINIAVKPIDINDLVDKKVEESPVEVPVQPTVDKKVEEKLTAEIERLAKNLDAARGTTLEGTFAKQLEDAQTELENLKKDVDSFEIPGTAFTSRMIDEWARQGVIDEANEKMRAYQGSMLAILNMDYKRAEESKRASEEATNALDREAKMAEGLRDAYASAFGAQEAKNALRQEEQKNAAKAADEYAKKQKASSAKAKKSIEEVIDSAKKLVQALNKVGKAAVDLGKSAVKLGFGTLKGMLHTFTLGLGSAKKEATLLSQALKLVGIAGIGALFKKANESATELTKNMNIVNEQFGASAAGLHKWAEQSAWAFNVSRTEAEKYFGELGDFLSNVGVEAEQSAVMVKNMVGYSGLIATRKGLKTEDVEKVFAKVIEGSTKGQAYKATLGIDLNDKAINSALKSMNIEATYNELNEADKATARWLATMYQLSDQFDLTADALGNFEGKISTWDGAIETITSNAKDALTDLGLILQHYLLPIVQVLARIVSALANSLRNLVGALGLDVPEAPALEDTADGIGKLGDEYEETGKKAKKAGLGLASFDKLNNLSSGSSADGLGGASSKLKDAVGLFDKIPDVSKQRKTLQEMLDSLMNKDWNLAGQNFGKWVNNIVNSAKSLIKRLKKYNLGKKLAEWVNGVFKSIDWKNAGELFGGLWDLIFDNIESFLRELNTKDVGTAIKDFLTGFNIQDKLGDIGTNFGLAIQKLSEIIKSVFDGEDGQKLLTDIKEGFSDMITNALEEINPSDLADGASYIIKAVLSAIQGIFNNANAKKLGKFTSTFTKEMASNGVYKDIGETFAGVITSAITYAGSVLGDGHTVVDLVNGLFEGIKNAFSDPSFDFSKSMKGIAKGVGEGLSSLGKQISDSSSGINVELNDFFSSEEFQTFAKGLADFLVSAITTAVDIVVIQLPTILKTLFEAVVKKIAEDPWGVTKTIAALFAWSKFVSVGGLKGIVTFAGKFAKTLASQIKNHPQIAALLVLIGSLWQGELDEAYNEAKDKSIKQVQAFWEGVADGTEKGSAQIDVLKNNKKSALDEFNTYMAKTSGEILELESQIYNPQGTSTAEKVSNRNAAIESIKEKYQTLIDKMKNVGLATDEVEIALAEFEEQAKTKLHAGLSETDQEVSNTIIALNNLTLAGGQMQLDWDATYAEMSQQPGIVGQAVDELGIKTGEVLPSVEEKMNGILTSANDSALSMGLLSGQADSAAEKFEGLVQTNNRVMKALEQQKKRTEQSEEALKKQKEETEKLKTENGYLSNAIELLSKTDLPTFKTKLEELNTPLDHFLDSLSKIHTSDFGMGKITDTVALQKNMDEAFRIVDEASKKIDGAIAEATNLRNFEATLSSTQTIKVDSSGTMNFKFDVTTKPDKDAFNSWQEKYTKANKALNG